MVQTGDAPSEFFYGTDLLQQEGLSIELVNLMAPYKGVFAGAHRLRERIAGRVFGLAYRTRVLTTLGSELSRASVAISFTDGFSLTLGNFFRHVEAGSPRLVGCFHCLSDIETRVPQRMRGFVTARIAEALRRLDVVAFFGPADRDYAIQRYQIPTEKTEIVRFGVDTEFWTPGSMEAGNHLFAIGQDPNRDFDTLIMAASDIPVHIHTGLKIEIPPERNNVRTSNGSYFNSTLTDIEVRDSYRKALAVVVPLKDVFQPTGYSVTLQAMACGKPVILTRNKGLWATDILHDGKNCLLVPPGDTRALAKAIALLRDDEDLRSRLGNEARRTAENHFCLRVVAESVRNLIDRALSAA